MPMEAPPRKDACAYTTSQEQPRWSTRAAKRSGRCPSWEGSPPHARYLSILTGSFWATSELSNNGEDRIWNAYFIRCCRTGHVSVWDTRSGAMLDVKRISAHRITAMVGPSRHLWIGGSTCVELVRRPMSIFADECAFTAESSR